MTTNATHRIRHYVYIGTGSDRQMIPREATMRGDWPCDAICSCGWESRTGGGLRAYVAREIAQHKRDAAYDERTQQAAS